MTRHNYDTVTGRRYDNSTAEPFYISSTKSHLYYDNFFLACVLYRKELYQHYYSWTAARDRTKQILTANTNVILVTFH